MQIKVLTGLESIDSNIKDFNVEPIARLGILNKVNLYK